MSIKSLLASALLLFASTVRADGQANIDLYTDEHCADSSIIVQLHPSISGTSGCSDPITVPAFRGARLNWSQGLKAVAICSQGYSCSDQSHNVIPETGICVRSGRGTFDKVQICIS
ncbi:hypothetical protein BJY01DRAFT_253556 [Aspergillus pseudoustus]|uniref:Uncharacterized protein n=1 Tax=Aspergillus pseudoustus TaxID=1810923 RepID=A0ABR4IZK2_9EURO